MELEIHSIENKGKLSDEFVWLKATADCELGHFMVADTTYINETTPSNEVRFTHWFYGQKLKKGEWVQLRTGTGTDRSYTDEKGLKVYVRHWQLGRTVWNKDGDCAILFKHATWKMKKV